MDIDQQTIPEAPAPAGPTPGPEPSPRPRALRRTMATLLLAAGLLGVGGVSAAWAASPDPSASTTAPANDGGSTAPDASQGTGGATRPKGNCPNHDGSGTPSDGSTSSPSTTG
jgi:hypothetical protein